MIYEVGKKYKTLRGEIRIMCTIENYIVARFHRGAPFIEDTKAFIKMMDDIVLSEGNPPAPERELYPGPTKL